MDGESEFGSRPGLGQPLTYVHTHTHTHSAQRAREKCTPVPLSPSSSLALAGKKGAALRGAQQLDGRRGGVEQEGLDDGTDEDAGVEELGDEGEAGHGCGKERGVPVERRAEPGEEGGGRR